MKWLKYFILILQLSAIHAQSTVLTQVDASEIQKIEFQINAVSSLNINTHKHTYILLKTTSEGEYQNNIFLVNQIEGAVFYLRSNFEERLEAGFDKLSAMKVFSFEIEVTIPENLAVFVESSTASIEATGVFYELNAALKTGDIRLNNFEGNAHLHTYSGNIYVSAKDVKVTASSRNGSLSLNQFLVERYFMEISSINGSIEVAPY